MRKARPRKRLHRLPPCPAAKVLWVFDMWDQTGDRPSDACNGSPLIDGDLLYVCTSNGVDREASVAYADNRKTPAPAGPEPDRAGEEDPDGWSPPTTPRTSGRTCFHGQWSSPSAGVVRGKKLIFFGGGDGVCYAFEALDSIPAKPVKLKTAWSFDCNPPEYKSLDGLDWATRYSLGDKRLKKSLNKTNDGRFVGMNEIISTPVFYKDRVYVAIGRDPEHGRGRGALWCIDAAGSGDITRSGCRWCYRGARSDAFDGRDCRRAALHRRRGRPRSLPRCRHGQMPLGLRDQGDYLGLDLRGRRQGLRAHPEISGRDGGGQGTAAPGARSAWAMRPLPRRWLPMGLCTSRRPATYGQFRSYNDGQTKAQSSSPAPPETRESIRDARARRLRSPGCRPPRHWKTSR